MAPRYCGVFGCKNNTKKTPDLTLFCLPKNEERKKIWTQLMCREDLLKKDSRYHFVCSVHFSKDMYTIKRLKSDAVPSLNLPTSESLLCCSFSKKNVETQKDDPVITNMKEVQPPTTMATVTQIENVSQEKQTLNENVSSKQSQYNQNHTNSTTMAAIETQTDSFSASEELDVEPVKSDISAQNPKTISATKRKLEHSVENYEMKRKECDKPKGLQTNPNPTSTGTPATGQNSEPCNEDKQAGAEMSCKKRKKENKNPSTSSNVIVKLYEWQKKLKAKYKSNRYDQEMKLFALNVYFHSPQTYRMLEKVFPLPPVRTLLKVKMIFKPGVNQDLIKLLSTRLTKLSPEHKYCVVCLDEMGLEKHLFYDIRNDEVIGFHDIDGNKRKELASNACVIMLRGCVKNYELPLGYALTAPITNYSDLGNWLDDTIRQLFDAGFVVCAVVSNQDSSFLNLANSKGVTNDSPFFFIGEKKVFYLFDVPDLFNSIRNNLLIYNFQYNGKNLACWSHLESFYNRDKLRPLRFRMAAKLTEAHIKPNTLQRKKVHYATQALSYTVAAGLSTDIEHGNLPPKAKETVELLIKLNKTFDVLNSSKVFDPKIYKNAFYGADFQQECLKDTLKTLKSIKAISPTNGKNYTNRIKAFSGLTTTINGIMQLHEMLKSEGLSFLFTRQLNKDPVEIFFGLVRQQGEKSREPTPIQFRRAFSKLVLKYLLKKSSLRICDEDLDLLFLIESENAKPFFANQMLSKPSPLAIQTSDYRSNLPSQNALHYVCGYLLKKCFLKHDCPAFKKYREHKENNIDDSQLFFHYIEFNQTNNFGSLAVPPVNFVNIIEKFEGVFLKIFDNLVFRKGAGANLIDAMKKNDYEAPCECFPIDYLMILYVRMRIYYEIQLNNRNLEKSSFRMPSFLKVRHL